MQHHLPLFTLVAVGMSNRKSYSSKQLANVESFLFVPVILEVRDMQKKKKKKRDA